MSLTQTFDEHRVELGRRSLQPQERDSLGLRRNALERLRDLIASGDLPVQTRHSESQVTRRLSMSRTPVREALAVLAAEGFVYQRPQVGFWVLPVEESELSELGRLRYGLEGEVVSTLAQHASEPSVRDGIDQLQQMADASRDLLASADGRDFARADTQFHVALAEHAGFISGASALGNWRERVRMFTNSLPEEAVRDSQTHAANEHQELIGHIGRGDWNEARSAAQRHIEASTERLLDAYRQLPVHVEPDLPPEALPHPHAPMPAEPLAALARESEMAEANELDESLVRIGAMLRAWSEGEREPRFQLPAQIEHEIEAARLLATNYGPHSAVE